jgi:hypothetical protein
MLVCSNREKGSIALAMAITIIAVLSGVSLVSVAFRDSNSFRNQLVAVQEFHYLRSEVERGRAAASGFEETTNLPSVLSLPVRKMRVEFGNYRKVYSATTTISLNKELAGTGYLIKTLISAATGIGDIAKTAQQSPVKRYGENLIKSFQTLAIFHCFSDSGLDHSGIPGNFHFSGLDVVHGRMHSNSDIYIRQTGGGNNLYPVNSRDYFGLVSEKQIIIQYGHRDSVDSLRYKPNTNNIYVYGALCALGKANGQLWDLVNHIYGRHTGQPSGYDKDYNFDTRFEQVGPPDYPIVRYKGFESNELMDLGILQYVGYSKNRQPTFRDVC